jgi:hypothetical protein
MVCVVQCNCEGLCVFWKGGVNRVVASHEEGLIRFGCCVRRGWVTDCCTIAHELAVRCTVV